MKLNRISLLKKFLILGLCVVSFTVGFLVCEVGQFHPLSSTAPRELPSLRVCFTPTQRCLPLICNALHEAKTRIYVQGYSLTSPSIGKALKEAHQSGIKVIVIADKSQKTSPHSFIKELVVVGIPVFIDAEPAIAHNKIIIVDDKIVLTGSYNFTIAAEKRNAENLLLIRDKSIIKAYEENFQRRLFVSEEYF